MPTVTRMSTLLMMRYKSNLYCRVSDLLKQATKNLDLDAWANPKDSGVIVPVGEIVAGPMRKESDMLIST